MQSFTLSQIGKHIKQALVDAFPQNIFWVRAEISEVRENFVSGHCYLDLVEKDEEDDRIVAKMRANIWSSVYKLLRPYFEEATGLQLTAGLKILVAVAMDYHEVYGISLNIKDIEPAYSLGDIARRRLQIINRLKEEGVFDMNRKLDFPLVPQRIAVISSATAAGYGDFMNQLENNRNNYRFRCKLFPAVMQGNQTEDSIIQAFDDIYRQMDSFDVVAIIRGGGATADLSAFDSYRLADYCAQFPLPVITGIGHQRDETILDLVAHTNLKTPTAAAEFLIDAIAEVDAWLNKLRTDISQNVVRLFANKNNELTLLAYRLENGLRQNMFSKKQTLSKLADRLNLSTNTFLKSKHRQLIAIEKNIELLSPENILRKGYTLTTKNGKIVTDCSDLQEGDVIETCFAGDNWVRSEVKD